MKNRLSILTAVIVLSTICASACLATQYSITLLGDFYPDALSNSGQVVAHYGGSTSVCFWSQTTGRVNLNGLSGATYMHGMNDLGEAVGSSYISSGDLRAVKWNSDRSVHDLSKSVFIEANGINDSGQIVGYGLKNGYYQARLLNPNGSVVDLTTPSGCLTSIAESINETGRIVGRSYDANNMTWKPVWWTLDGACTVMENLGGSESSSNYVNNDGISVGYSTTAVNNPRAAMWDANGQVTDLGWRGEAFAVNSSGTVAGHFWSWTDPDRAMIWDNGVATDLNTLLPANSGWTLASATGINDSGQIVGRGNLGAYLLTPVPEPSGVFALIFGLSGAGALAMKRRK